MTSETTPLVESLVKQVDNKEVVQDVMKLASDNSGVLTEIIKSNIDSDNKEGAQDVLKLASENAAVLTEIIKSNIDSDKAKEIASQAFFRMKEISQKAIDGDLNIRLLAILSAVCVLVTSITSITGRLITLHFVNAVIDFYTACFCLIVISIETNEKDCIYFGGSIIRSIHGFMSKNFQFFDHITGRGVFYFFIGTLKITQPGLFSLLSGILMSVIGAMYCYFGHRASQVLKKSQVQFRSKEELKLLFHDTDHDNSGTIDLDEFKCLIQVLGLQLNKREMELAFMIMDKTQSQTIGFDEFTEFWERSKNDNPYLDFLV